jgi:hypothetical protein
VDVGLFHLIDAVKGKEISIFLQIRTSCNCFQLSLKKNNANIKSQLINYYSCIGTSLQWYELEVVQVDDGTSLQNILAYIQ